MVTRTPKPVPADAPAHRVEEAVRIDDAITSGVCLVLLRRMRPTACSMPTAFMTSVSSLGMSRPRAHRVGAAARGAAGALAPPWGSCRCRRRTPPQHAAARASATPAAAGWPPVRCTGRRRELEQPRGHERRAAGSAAARFFMSARLGLPSRGDLLLLVGSAPHEEPTYTPSPRSRSRLKSTGPML